MQTDDLTPAPPASAPSNSKAKSKRELRSVMRARRAGLSASVQKQAARRFLRHGLPRLRHLRRIAFFLGINGEPDLQPLLLACAALGIDIALPRLAKTSSQQPGPHMHFYRYRPGQRLQKNRYGIKEPDRHRRFRLNEIDLILMPLTAFDARGRRLGMGGGFYDRALAPCARNTLRRPWRIGVAYSWQEQTELSVEPWDIPLHGLLSERGWRRF